MRKTNYTILLQSSHSRKSCLGGCAPWRSCLFWKWLLVLPVTIPTAHSSWQILHFYENTFIFGRSDTYLCCDVKFGPYLVLLCGDWAEKVPTSLIDVAEFIAEWRSLRRSGHWRQTLEGCKLFLVSISSFSSSPSSSFSIFPVLHWQPSLPYTPAANLCLIQGS